MKTIVFLIGMLFFIGSGTTQISNPYNTPLPIDCWALNQNSFNLNPNIFKHFSCFELPGNNTVSVTGLREVELSAGKEIHLKPGFSVTNLSGNGNFHAMIEKEDVGVAVFAPLTSLGEVPKCEKLELGLNLPDAITDQIENYFNGVPHDAINPFDPDQISIEANFIHYTNESLNYYEQHILPLALRNTATVRQSFGFYYEEFHTDYSVYTDGNWIRDTTSFDFRIRFSPNETGVWRTEIKIFVQGQLLYTLKPIYFRCTPSNCPGFIVGGATTNDNRHFVFENGDEFFGIGQNIAWADKPNTTMPPGYGPTRTQPPSGYVQQREYIEDLAENGGNLVRILSAEWTDALEWEKLGDYKKSMPFAWEFDQTFDLLSEKDIYILWCMQTHTAFMYENPFSADDSQAWPGNPYNTQLGLPTLESFFTDSQAWDFYKKKIRYLMARWGYSSKIAGLQPFSEINEIAGNDANVDPYFTITSFREDVNNRVIEIKNYIQVELKYNFNIGTSFTSDLGGSNGKDDITIDNDAMSEADFNDWHPYSDGRNRNLGGRWGIINDDSGWALFEKFNKPVIIGENGLNSYQLYDCKENDWHNDLWASSMMGGWATGLPWYLWKGEHNTRENFNFVREFFDTYIDFKNIDWEPMRWPGVPASWSNFFWNPDLTDDYAKKFDNYFEALYMTGDGDHINDKRAFGWVHNRSDYWYNKLTNCENAIITSNNLIAPGDDDPNNSVIINSGNGTNKYRKLRMFHMSNYQIFDIRWFNPLTGVEYIPTQETHGSGDFIVTIPNNVNFTQYNDLVFLMYPNNSSFYTPGSNSPGSEIFVLDENNDKKDSSNLNKIVEETDFNIFVYPNPTNQVVNVNCSEEIISIEICNIMGEKISTKVVNDTSTTIDMIDFSRAVYILKIICLSKNHIVRIVYQ